MMLQRSLIETTNVMCYIVIGSHRAIRHLGMHPIMMHMLDVVKDMFFPVSCMTPSICH